ncbi:hypothetical protein QV08_10585 [Gallibacterium salpingitidis]|uniref:Hemagglutinin n=2 Tax=Gallibacterium salpingitidis TaxID=505341 RepID=A0AB36DZH6_9PAST|nr:hypothetical protein [Gallibacterium salpingitidis]OBX06304.1 hypothetical protein QV08_10585 [Gallibacterium salpingitidis]OBX06329.1 hypothetical protein QV09_12285 [Gallibacterium salpingitidis]
MDMTGPAIEYSNPELDKKYQAAHRIYNSLDYQFGKSTLEGLAVLGNSGNAIIKGVTTVETLARGISDKAFITALKAEKAMSKISPALQWLEKHPIASETLIAGTVSTGFDVYNDKFTPEGAMMNYVLSGITAGKSLSKQLSINTIYQGIVSANDNTKNDKEVLEDITKKNLGVAAGYSSSILANKIGLYGIKAVLSSTIIGTYIENVDTNYSNLNSKDEK